MDRNGREGAGTSAGWIENCEGEARGGQPFWGGGEGGGREDFRSGTEEGIGGDGGIIDVTCGSRNGQESS